MPSVFVVMALPAEDPEGKRRTSFEVVEMTEGESIPETMSMIVWHAGIYRTADAAFDRCRTEVQSEAVKANAKYSVSETLHNRRPMTRQALAKLFDDVESEIVAEREREHAEKMRLWNAMPKGKPTVSKARKQKREPLTIEAEALG